MLITSVQQYNDRKAKLLSDSGSKITIEIFVLVDGRLTYWMFSHRNEVFERIRRFGLDGESVCITVGVLWGFKSPYSVPPSPTSSTYRSGCSAQLLLQHLPATVLPSWPKWTKSLTLGASPEANAWTRVTLVMRPPHTNRTLTKTPVLCFKTFSLKDKSHLDKKLFLRKWKKSFLFL